MASRAKHGENECTQGFAGFATAENGVAIYAIEPFQRFHETDNVGADPASAVVGQACVNSDFHGQSIAATWRDVQIREVLSAEKK